MNHLVKLTCDHCGRHFFLLKEDLPSESKTLCSHCLKLFELDPILQEGIVDVIKLYEEGKTGPRIRIESTDDEDEK